MEKDFTNSCTCTQWTKEIKQTSQFKNPELLAPEEVPDIVGSLTNATTSTVDPIMPEGNIPSTTASKEPIEEPTLSPLPKIVEVIKSKVINVHSEPKIESVNIIHQLMTGAQVIYMDENKGWYQVELDNGEKGWVIKKYTKLLE